jgi:ElaB/YqjD/DUF883 family membrane-anchored ribosome-binding protein
MVTMNESVTKGLKGMGDIATDTVKETAAQMQENASACYERGRDKASQVERTFDQFIREQPLKSVLIAAGIGLLLGRFWKR